MRWTKVFGKTAKYGAISAAGALLQALLEAGRLSALDWDRLGAVLIAALISGAIGGGINWGKHRGQLPEAVVREIRT